MPIDLYTRSRALGRAKGARASQQVRAQRFGVAFVDYSMPVSTGSLRFRKFGGSTPDRGDDTSSLDAALADDRRRRNSHFLKKPFYPADIDVIFERCYGLNG